MASDTVILKAEGIVSAADFRVIVDAFTDLIAALTAETNASAAIEWMIDDLRGGSATIVSRAISGNRESEHTAELVVAKWENVAVAANKGALNRFSDRVRGPVQAMSSVINGRIPRLLLGTPEHPTLGSIDRALFDDVVPDTSLAIVPGVHRLNSRAAVKGQVVTLDDKRSTYFTLQEAYSLQSIRCYPTKEEHRAKLGEYWTKKTWVIVEGTYSRYGGVPTIVGITDIVPLPDDEKGGWRQAVGAAPRRPDAQDITSAEAVRRVRDGKA